MSAMLPSLNGLRAFEAAARLGSFTAAASELHVTQTAVSHQIRRLEDQVGTELFRRQGRALSLTYAGRELLPSVRIAFEELHRGAERLRRRNVRRTVTVSTLPSLAATWLVPRLVRFQAEQPEIDVRVTTSPHAVDFAREEVDVAIRFGHGHWPGCTAERLFCEAIFPVCSPALLDGPKPLREPADLVHHTLLHVLSFQDDWRLWLTAAGVGGVDPTRGTTLDVALNAMRAAADGMGIAIGRSRLVGDELQAGRLVAPFPMRLPVEAAYYLVYPTGRESLPEVAAFRRWVLALAGRPA